MLSVPFIAFLVSTCVWMFKLVLGAWRVVPIAWNFLAGGVHAVTGVLHPKDFAHAILFGIGVFVSVLQVLSSISSDFATVTAALAAGLVTLMMTAQKWLGDQTEPTPPKPI